MASEPTLYLNLTILLAVATLSHFTIKRFHQPTIIGEIGIGIVMGPTVVGFILNGWQPVPPGATPFFDETFISVFAAMGAIFLLFLIGLESEIKTLFTRKNMFVALGGVLLPLLAGFLLAFFLVPDTSIPLTSTRFAVSVFVGAALVATSTAIAAAVLLELGLMRHQVAQTIMGAAVVDDILGLLVLSMAEGFVGGSVSVPNLLVLVLAAAAFIVVGIWVGARYFGRLVVVLQARGRAIGLEHGGFLIALAVAFLYALVAEAIGLSAIIGAFVAGAMFANNPLKRDFHQGTTFLGAVFTPMFFISLGLLVNLWALAGRYDLALFVVLLAGFAVVTKVVGCALPARWSGMDRMQSLAVGFGMAPRGEVGLVVALIAFQGGIIGTDLFSSLVIVMVVVSILPAPLLRHYLLRMRTRAADTGP